LADFIAIAPRAGQLAGNLAIESAFGTVAGVICLFILFADLFGAAYGHPPTGLSDLPTIILHAYRLLFCMRPNALRARTAGILCAKQRRCKRMTDCRKHGATFFCTATKNRPV